MEKLKKFIGFIVLVGLAYLTYKYALPAYESWEPGQLEIGEHNAIDRKVVVTVIAALVIAFSSILAISVSKPKK
jgi:hypothetical protein